MAKPRTSKSSLPRAVNRFMVPAILFLIAMAMIVVFVITLLSVAGFTPGF
jgi:hypothetical protein